MGRKLTGKKPKPATLRQRRWRANLPKKAARLRREASRTALPMEDGFDYSIGDCREVLADIRDNSVALILTDPPYAFAADPLWHWIAEFAARWLCVAPWRLITILPKDWHPPSPAG
jgi:hypothetical protein